MPTFAMIHLIIQASIIVNTEDKKPENEKLREKRRCDARQI
jgi:hypothetical protein